jgi:hypothetical protein
VVRSKFTNDRSFPERLRWSTFALIAAGGLGLWLLWSLSSGQGRTPSSPTQVAVVDPPRKPEANDESFQASSERPEGSPPLESTARLRAAEPSDPPATASERPLGVHPVDERRDFIHRENSLIQAANDAMDLGNAEALRGVLARYREHDPNDESGHQEGYAIIANCLDRSGPESRAAAERFITERRASILRRFVRRHCLGEP